MVFRHIGLRFVAIRCGREGGMGHWIIGEYGEAIEASKKALHRREHMVPACSDLTASYSLLGRDEEARAEAAEVLGLSSIFQRQCHLKIKPIQNALLMLYARRG